MLQRRVRAVQTVQKLEIHRAVLRRCLRAYCCALTGAGDGPDRAENREVSARVLGLGSMPVVVQRQVPDGRDSAENCGVSAVGAGSWTRLLTCPCWPRQGLSRFRGCSSSTGVWQLIMDMMRS